MEHDVKLTTEEVSLPEHGLWARLPMLAGGVGLGGLALSLGLGFGTGAEKQFFHSYLVAFMFWLSLALGGLFFVLLQFVTRAGWSVVVRRVAEHVMGTLPLFAVLFVPIGLGLHDLYHWSHAEAVAADPLLQHKEAYLNPTRFFIFAAIYLAAWSFLGWWFRREAGRQDSGDGPAILRRLQSLSAPALIIFAVTLTFAAFDWMMTLDPHWYSTIFGVYYFAGSVMGILALLVLLLLALQRAGRLEGIVTGEHFYDLGKLLFAFVVFWAYIAFSQFMLIWYGNIPEETLWYSHRWEHGWKPISIFLAVGHFAVPFLFLLPKDFKRKATTLIIAALWLLGMHYLDLFWLIMPNFHGHFALHLLDFTCWLGIGGLFLAVLGRLMRRGSLVPTGDPRLQESLSFESV